MGTKVAFAGKIIKQPGVYARILSGVKNPPLVSDFGKVMIIDNGIGAGFGGGSGIKGELKTGVDSVYRGFSDIEDFRDFVKGGILWDLAQPLFRPNRVGAAGVSSIDIVRAATTASASLTYTFTGGGTAGGSITVKFKDEGTVGNGVKDSGDILRRGYAMVMTAHPDIASHYVLSLYRGTFKGLDLEGHPYGDNPENLCPPDLLSVSAPFDNVSEIVAWMNADKTFQSYASLSASTVTGTGAVNAADLTANSAIELAAGGTETYHSDRLEEVLEAIAEMDYVFMLSDKYGSDAADATNLRIQYHILNEAKYDKFLFVGGGEDESEFDQADGSIDSADVFDNEKVVVVHSGIKKNNKFISKGYRQLPSLYHAAYVLGRTAGLPPQVPVTSKSIDVDGVTHQLSYKKRDKAIDSGVLHTFFDTDYGSFVVNQGINTLQSNDFTVNPDGQTHSIQIARIKAQLNKEIIVNAKKDLLGNPNGVNRNTLSEEDVKQWLEGYLQSRIASDVADNLLIAYQDITVRRIQDYYDIKYGFYPNSEINKLFFTGLILD